VYAHLRRQRFYNGRKIMHSFSVWHWIIVALYAYIFVAPCWRIAKRAGFSGAWALLAIVPLVNIVILWVFAYVKWPTERSTP
jgi:hypothetical protein